MKLSKGDIFPDFIFDTDREVGLSVHQVVQKAERTIFWVLRYIGCTTCRYDIQVLAQSYDRIKDKKAQVFVVMQSSVQSVQEDLKDSPLPFPIVCDHKQIIYGDLEIPATETREERLPKTEADVAKLQRKKAAIERAGITHGRYEGNEQQLPAMFITDSKGTVTYAHYGTNMVDMPTVEEVLDLI